MTDTDWVYGYNAWTALLAGDRPALREKTGRRLALGSVAGGSLMRTGARSNQAARSPGNSLKGKGE